MVQRCDGLNGVLIQQSFSIHTVMNQEIAEDATKAINYVTSWMEQTSAYRLFTEVPQKKKISYLTHLWRHAKQSIYFGYLAICFWIHAFFPFLLDPIEANESDVDQSVLKPEKESLGNGTTL